MKMISSLLMVLFLALTADTAYVILKGGKKGRVDITDSSELYDSTLNSFKAVSKNGNYTLLKQDVECLIIESDTLRFVGNVAQRGDVTESKETVVSDELPAPLSRDHRVVPGDELISEIEDVSAPDQTEVIGDHKSGRLLTEMESNRKVSVHGLIVYCFSLGLQYGVALPLNNAAIRNEDQGLGIASLVVSAIAGGMSISGPTRCSVGASLTYDTSRKYNLGLDKNINWAFYGVGWALQAVNSVMGVLVFSDPSLINDLALPSMLIGLGSSGMFLASVANASYYSRTGLNKVKHASLKMDIVPVVSVENRCAGMVLNCSF